MKVSQLNYNINQRISNLKNSFWVKIRVAIEVNGPTPQTAQFLRPLDCDAPLNAGLRLADTWLARQLGYGP